MLGIGKGFRLMRLFYKLPRMKVWVGLYQHTHPMWDPELQCVIHAHC